MQGKKREKVVIIYKMRKWDWYKRGGIEKCRRYVTVVILFIYLFIISYIIF